MAKRAIDRQGVAASLGEEVLVAVAGDGFPPSQITAAIESLAGREAKIPTGIRKLPPYLVTAVQRVRLIEAMLAESSEQPFRKVSAEGVARRVGLSEATFYSHFDSKEQCFLVAFDAAATRLRNHLDGVLASSAGSRGCLQPLLGELLVRASTEPVLVRTLLVTAAEVPDAAPLRDQLLEELAGYIQDAVARDLNPQGGGAQAAALRSALAGERTEVRAVEAVVAAYRSNDERLRAAIGDIALPALLLCEPVFEGAAQHRKRLEDAMPGRVDEARIRADVWSDQGWLSA